MPAESIRSGAAAWTSTPATIPTHASSNGSQIRSTKPGSQTASLLTRIRISVRASAAPRLTARPKPRFRSFRTRRTRGNSPATISAVPSPEPLSTTTTSGRTVCCSRLASASRSRSRASSVGMTTVEDTRARYAYAAAVARVLVCSADPVGRAMAGPGIRYLHFARELAKRHDVTLAAPERPDAGREPFDSVAAPRRFGRFAARFDVVVAQRLPPATMHQLARTGTRTIYVLCASERQRDLWLGALAALGRLDVSRYREDPAFRGLVAVVPFGLEERRPVAEQPALKGAVPGIEEDARVLLWGGGLWDWLDPLTVIRAVAELARSRDDVRLYFPSTRHPGGEQRWTMANRAQELARGLGLEGRIVVFGERWIPYTERDGYLLGADVGVSAHLDTVEARFAFRTRVLDYLWAELPCVLTEGDVLADLLAR